MNGNESPDKQEKNKHEFHNPLLNILYEDAYIIVVEKKEGLLSVATDRQKERTAQHILNEYVKRQNPRNRVFVVHRLDRRNIGSDDVCQGRENSAYTGATTGMK